MAPSATPTKEDEMKKFLLLALLCLQPISSHALDSAQTRHVGRHVVASALLVGASYVVTQDMQTSILIALGLGLGKELYDSSSRNGSGFGAHDLAANAVGVVIGVLWVEQF